MVTPCHDHPKPGSGSDSPGLAPALQTVTTHGLAADRSQAQFGRLMFMTGTGARPACRPKPRQAAAAHLPAVHSRGPGSCDIDGQGVGCQRADGALRRSALAAPDLPCGLGNPTVRAAIRLVVVLTERERRCVFTVYRSIP